MNSAAFTTAITTLANAIACKLTVNELSLLAVTLTQLGDTLATIATQRTFCEELNESTENDI